MSNDIFNQFNSNSNASNNSNTYSTAVPSSFIANVFSYMFGALAMTGVVAWIFGNNVELLVSTFFTEQGKISGLGYLILFAPLGVGFVIQRFVEQLNIMALLGLFLLYSALLGMSLGSIFIVFELGSIATVFFITSGTYAAMAVLGYTTKQDLTKFGGIMYMLFIGLFIASMVNIFMQSDGLSWLISVIGVFVFTGLTAYKMQEIKNFSQYASGDSATSSKYALVFGLQMYILFINLFMSLLNLLGERK